MLDRTKPIQPSPKRDHRGDKGAGEGQPGLLVLAPSATELCPWGSAEEALWPAEAGQGVEWLGVKLPKWPDLLTGLYRSVTNAGHAWEEDEHPPRSGVRPRQA